MADWDWRWPGIPDGVPVFRVHTSSKVGDVGSADSCMATVPAGVLADGALDVRQLGRALRDLTERQARLMGARLHHADWTVTRDPAVIQAIGRCVHPDCVRCVAETDQALAYLAEEPGRALIAGVLYWAGDHG